MRQLRDGELSSRMALHLLFKLPGDSRFVGETRGGTEYTGWDNQMYLSAFMVDILNQILYVLTASNSKKKPQKPKPVWTPDRKEKRKNGNIFEAQLKAQMDKLR